MGNKKYKYEVIRDHEISSTSNGIQRYVWKTPFTTKAKASAHLKLVNLESLCKTARIEKINTKEETEEDTGDYPVGTLTMETV